MTTEQVTERLLPLIGEIDGRKLGCCPECLAGPIWNGLWEYADHVQDCVRIRLGRAWHAANIARVDQEKAAER